MRILVTILTFLTLLLHAVPVQAADALPPGHQASPYVRWSYPSQMKYGPIENGNGKTGMAAAAGAFLTLPFMAPEYITSIFDHCSPDYGINGHTCRYDGVIASAKVGGPDPTFDAGYAQTPGGQDYVYYDGHDGYDYGLYYEPVAAAAGGVVMLSGWAVPSCHTCLSGLTIEIDHGNGLLSYYGHLSQLDVSVGQRVRRGQVIGLSGSTGTATGPHLHFGIYRIGGGGPIDPYGWGGSYPDPYSKDIGDLWLTGSPRYANIPMPKVTITAVASKRDPKAITVSWSSPGGGDQFAVYAVGLDGAFKKWAGNAGAGKAVFHGQPGAYYWFWASVTTDLGWKDANGSSVVWLKGNPRTEQ
ncbi:MAG TPA: M23 family metallopeptidase [Candidatus Dormibacteraeota bacterium]